MPSSALSLTFPSDDGIAVNQLAFGLYQIPAADAFRLTTLALKSGYRHLDSASFYANEKQVGEAVESAIAEGVCKRKELYVCGKVWNDAQLAGPEAVQASVLQTLSNLRLTYIDLFLVHWPVPSPHHITTYKTLEKFVKSGQIKQLGVSNYNKQEYAELIASGITVPVACNQIEISPLMYRRSDIEYFQSQGLLMGAYKPLQRSAALNNELIRELAKKYEKTEAQILIRWSVQKGFIVITKTSSYERMLENRNVEDFVLEEGDVEKMEMLTTKEAVVEREGHEKIRKEGLK